MARAATVLACAATLGWLLCALFLATETSFSGLVSWSFLAGTLALWAMLLSCVAALFLPLLWPGWFEPRPLRLVRAELAWIAGCAAATLPLGWLVRACVRPLIPSTLSYPDDVATVLGAQGALGLVAVVGIAVARLRGVSFPTFALFGSALVARVMAAGAAREVLGKHAPWYELAFLALLVAAGHDLARAAGKRLRVASALLTVLAIANLFATIEVRSSDRAAFLQTYPQPSGLMFAAASLFDMDRDGVPAVLGGGDCDDFDPGVGPSALEIVGNGVDDNCMGGDLAALAPRPPIERVAGAPARNLILVTLDAARAELLSPKYMPRLAERAPKYAVFERAYAPSNHTTSSFVAMTTGQYVMGAQRGFRGRVGKEPPLPELLAATGYHTLLAFQAHFSMDGSWRPESWFKEVDRELSRHNQGDRGATSELTTERAIAHVRRLEAQHKPYFAWFHYLDMHEEYMPRAGTPFSSDRATQRYLQEAWSVDKDLGRFLDFLEHDGFFERDGILVVHSDHGEVVEDGGRTGHAYYVDEEVLRVLLLMRGAGIEAGRYRTRVSLVDLYPTLLELTASIRAPSFGRHLKRVWTGSDVRDEPVFVASFYDDRHLHVAIIDRFKLVEDLRLGARWLYDLETDPGEQHNLAERAPEIVSEIRTRLGRIYDLSMNDQVLMRRGILRPVATR